MITQEQWIEAMLASEDPPSAEYPEDDMDPATKRVILKAMWEKFGTPNPDETAAIALAMQYRLGVATWLTGIVKDDAYQARFTATLSKVLAGG